MVPLASLMSSSAHQKVMYGSCAYGMYPESCILKSALLHLYYIILYYIILYYIILYYIILYYIILYYMQYLMPSKLHANLWALHYKLLKKQVSLSHHRMADGLCNGSKKKLLQILTLQELVRYKISFKIKYTHSS